MNSLENEEAETTEETIDEEEKPQLTDADMARLSEIMTELGTANANKEEKNKIKEKLIAFFRQTGLKSYRTKDLVLRFVDERDTMAFDVEMLQTKYPEVWKECHTKHHRDANVNIRKIADIPSRKKTADAVTAAEAK
jgi:hypothetical protein